MLYTKGINKLWIDKFQSLASPFQSLWINWFITPLCLSCVCDIVMSKGNFGSVDSTIAKD